MDFPGLENGGFEAGLYTLILGLFGGFLITLFAYFWAELINIGVSIAQNLEKIAKSGNTPGA